MYFPKRFNIALAIELGELIKQAYDQFEEFKHEKDWRITGGYSLIKELRYLWTPEKTREKSIHNYDSIVNKFARFEKDEAAQIPIGFIAQRKKSLYVILRGTQTAKEWVRNFSIRLHPYLLPNHGKVHEGFMQTYTSIREDIMEIFSSIHHNMKLYVAGHSLGAALATLALPDIESTKKCRIRALYTYGSPRMGDDKFVKAFNRSFQNRSFRIVNTSDLVTSIPLPVPLAGIVGGYFSHVDIPVNLTVQDDDLEKNHCMETYLSQLYEQRRRKGFFAKLLDKMR
jgi:triacylglycerol lipase